MHALQQIFPHAFFIVWGSVTGLTCFVRNGDLLENLKLFSSAPPRGETMPMAAQGAQLNACTLIESLLQ